MATRSLQGKVALVTGGSRGIGAAAARALADQGADVAISYASSADKAAAIVRELESKGVRAASFRADQANSVEVEALIQSVAKRFGQLDILVNNAGVFQTGTVDDPASDVEQFNRQMAVNVGGVITAIRAAARIMREGGRIISVGSALGTRVGYPGMADYAATKAAVVGYSRGIARDLGPRRITVNVIQPGAIDTDMNPADSAGAAAFNSSTALGRYGRPEEIAAGIVFLASPEASYVTGTVLTIDGGYTA